VLRCAIAGGFPVLPALIHLKAVSSRPTSHHNIGEVKMAGNIVDINDSNFEKEVIQSEKPVMVDFWAPWCGPCKAIGPVVETLAGDYDGKVKFAKCNVDDNPITPSKYGIKAIPTLIFFKGGSVVDQITGMVARARLEESLTKLV
jgi:thioredoxin 1